MLLFDIQNRLRSDKIWVQFKNVEFIKRTSMLNLSSLQYEPIPAPNNKFTCLWSKKYHCMMQFPFEEINRRIRTKTSHGISSPKEWSQKIWFTYTILNLNENTNVYVFDANRIYFKFCIMSTYTRFHKGRLM